MGFKTITISAERSHLDFIWSIAKSIQHQSITGQNRLIDIQAYHDVLIIVCMETILISQKVEPWLA